jgi:hypothetical protein
MTQILVADDEQIERSQLGRAQQVAVFSSPQPIFVAV